MSSTSSVDSDCSNDASVELPIVCYDGYDGYHGIRGPTDDLVHAVLAGDCARARCLSMLGFAVPAADSWVVYQACLQGIKMMHSLSFSARANLNRVMPWQMGDRNFHFLLRTPSDRFMGTKMIAIAYLIRHGAHPLEPDRLGNTALHILAEVLTQTETDGFGILRNMLKEDNNEFISRTIRDTCRSKIDTRNIPTGPGEGNVARLLLDHGAIVTTEIEEDVRSLEMAQVLQEYQEIQMVEDSSDTSED
ncbi:hypothetical protein HZS61_010502 [Fusarium oxysporum f. sp. conglutinans]|uniref:Ankyrin repeat protein n=1 Tax=Fusarium oxysporum f. sp. conglutinans TaxID=100902 RepID=A0A8H6GZG4_FUSOX|nr:hypothetical protein HZS61_010502 [Fusarium oxysporum f. sp. conglutinans]